MKNQKIVKNYLDALKINNQIKTLEDITKLIKSHLRTFPFVSLKILLKEDIFLDLDSVYESLVVKKRGAYCWSKY